MTTSGSSPSPRIAIVGAGICGLALALGLHRRGIVADVYEAVSDVREIGVGITLLPHAMRELDAFGLVPALEAAGIVNYESVFFNRFGQYVYRELRGRHAGYALPEVSLHRGRLHRILFDAVVTALGAGRVHLGQRCQGFRDEPDGAVVLRMTAPDGRTLPEVRADAVVACDGVNSAIRAQVYPGEGLAFTGINTWRGLTRFPRILTGRSYLRIGSIDTGKMVIYPIADGAGEDERGPLQWVNWVAEIRRLGGAMNDWNQTGRPDDFIEHFRNWRYGWLDVPALITQAERIFEYPMVDRDPVPRWTFGGVTLAGDAAHPMYPRGSNGAAQSLIDARVLAQAVAEAARTGAGWRAALGHYEDQRREATARVVLANRSTPPDTIIMKADELSGGEPFRHIDELISPDALRAISENYQQVAGFAKSALAGAPAGPGGTDDATTQAAPRSGDHQA